MLRAFLLLFCAPFLAPFALAQPVAPIRPVEDDYFGKKIVDPYRYLEDAKDPEVQAWMKAQAEHAQSVLARLPGRSALHQRMLELDNSGPAKVAGVIQLANGRIFYRKRGAKDDAWKLYTRLSATAPEVLLVDPEEQRARTGQPHALNYFTPSWDGTHLAFGLSAAGSEDASLQILEVASRRLVDTPISRCQYPSVSWLPDGRGFTYTRLQELKPGMPATEKYQRARAFLHRLGTDPETDAALVGLGLEGSPKLEPTEGPYLTVDRGGKWLIATVTAFVKNEVAYYVAPLADLEKRPIAWKQICGFQDEITAFALHGDDIFLLSHKGATRSRILKTSLAAPDLARAVVTVPEQPTVVLRGLAAAGDGLYLEVGDAVLGRIWRLGYGAQAKPEPLELPFAGIAYLLPNDPRRDGMVLRLQSWTNYGGFFDYRPKTKACRELTLTTPGPFDAPKDLVSEEVEVKSHDGALVPLSIIRRRETKRDGANPTLMIGYGSYGATTDPNFEHLTYAWLERGGILAHAHVRGGGSKGEAWYRAGYQATKPNTWKDFIACAEYLIAQGYTSPAKLAGSGTSAGGILIGRAVTERPDLFGAVVPRVGCLNAVRLETTANGVPNIPEFGSCRTETGFQALYEMDALHHVRDGGKYPAVLLTHGANDPRVEPWQSAKFAARLQAATGSGKPVLLRLDYEGGHGVGATKTQRLGEWADIYAFLLWQFGVGEFQPH